MSFNTILYIYTYLLHNDTCLIKTFLVIIRLLCLNVMKVNNPTSIPINKLEVNDVIKYNEIKWKIYEIFHDTILIRRYHMIPGSYSDNYKWLDRDTLVKRVK